MANDGGAIIGEILKSRGVKYLFTLCGGHISPILVGAEANGIKVVDVRDEVSAVFAADAVARMTGVPGVAAVTAGPGVTNTITALKNAQMAQSPLVLFGGAAATLLKGRGSLQDIDQISVLQSITKWAVSVKKVKSIGPTVEKAFDIAQEGVPGPVFVEMPIDLLYSEEMVREMLMKEVGTGSAKNLGSKALELYMRGHLYRQFNQPHVSIVPPVRESLPPKPANRSPHVQKVASLLRKAERPALVIGSQALINTKDAQSLGDAVRDLGVPTWLGGMARGLLGRYSDIQFRSRRRMLGLHETQRQRFLYREAVSARGDPSDRRAIGQENRLAADSVRFAGFDLDDHQPLARGLVPERQIGVAAQEIRFVGLDQPVQAWAGDSRS